MKRIRHLGTTFTGVMVALALNASHPLTAGESFFIGLGDLPGGNFRSGADGISADGSTVVGGSDATDGGHAYVWRIDTGMRDLGLGVALDTSSDGSVIAGIGFLDGDTNWDAFRWTDLTGREALGMPASLSYSMGISNDGSVIVGADEQGATRWTEATGTIPMGSPFPGRYNAASDVSGDGLVVVGQQESPAGPSSREQAFQWTQATGWTLLGTLFGAGGSVATATNGDGSVVVGFTGYGFFEAFRWTPSEGIVGLGELPGGAYSSSAWDVSADGSIVVGNSSTSNGPEAFVWDAVNGMRNLKSVLIDEGLDLTGWTLTGAAAISADGRTFTGTGINPFGIEEAWIARLGPLPGDFNNDGTVNAADYIVWRKGYGTNYNQDDYNDWQANFGATIGSGSSPFAASPLTFAIPEPTSALLFLSFAVIGAWRHRRGLH